MNVDCPYFCEHYEFGPHYKADACLKDPMRPTSANYYKDHKTYYYCDNCQYNKNKEK